MSQFNVLSEKEYNQIKDAFAQIAILIAGADGNIDEDERSWAEKLTKIRSYAGSNKDFKGLYTELNETINDRIESLLTSLPPELENREKALSEKLTELNVVLEKLEYDTSRVLYNEYISYAKHIAKASGGFIGIGSISSAEDKWVELSMINTIVKKD